jgi:hypothetical protein
MRSWRPTSSSRSHRKLGSSAPKDKAHRLSIPLDQLATLVAYLGWPVTGKDAANLLERDRDTFHRGGGRDGLDFQVTPQTALPGSRQRALEIESFAPLVELSTEVKDGLATVREEHERILSLKC